jgi:hypothetical protein
MCNTFGGAGAPECFELDTSAFTEYTVASTQQDPDMSMRIAPDDSRLTWHGSASLEQGEGWIMPWRIPHERRALFPHVEVKAAMPAGVRLAMYSDTRFVRGVVEVDPDTAPIDLVVDGEVRGTEPLAGRTEFEFRDLPGGRRHIELWLPQGGRFRLRGLELSDGASLEPAADERRRWITYGSSITQCREAASPTRTWPAVVARQCDLNLRCLGFGGECKLDINAARLMRDLPADLLSMCVGINCYDGALSRRTFLPSILGFVEILRERHTHTPLVVMSPILSPPREQVTGGCGMTLPDMRQQVAEAVQILKVHGDPAIHHIDGLSLLGPEQVHMLPDALHPNTDGYAHLAERFTWHLRSFGLIA